MKILAAAAFAADSAYAHAINTIKMADGFAKLGHEVTLVCRRPPGGVVPEAILREAFGLDARVSFVQLRSTLLGRPLGPHRAFSRQVARQARRLRPDFAYCRNYLAPVALSGLGVPVALESHAHPGSASPHLRQVAAAAARVPAFRTVVTIAPVLRDHFAALGVPADKILVLPDAVDLAMFRRPATWTRDSERQRPSIVYAGHLYDYKGIPTVLEAAARLPHCEFQLIGGTDEDIERQRRRIADLSLTNVTLVGRLPHQAVPERLWRADVLLLPPSARHPSAQWTSPVKLGEYLASGVPVVASRIPALEHWLRHDEVVFAQPDDPASLAAAIRRALEDEALVRSTTRRALALAETLTYESRCQRILAKAFG